MDNFLSAPVARGLFLGKELLVEAVLAVAVRWVAPVRIARFLVSGKAFEKISGINQISPILA